MDGMGKRKTNERSFWVHEQKKGEEAANGDGERDPPLKEGEREEEENEHNTLREGKRREREREREVQ